MPRPVSALGASAASVSERLGTWIASVRAEQIPERVLALARDQLLSVAAAVHAGVDTDESRAVAKAVQRRASPGPVTVLPTGERLALADALTINSARSMALDYDDYLYMGHTGHSAVLASLAVCELEGRTPADLLVAQVVANEIAGRVGASCVLGPQNGQAWSFIHAAGAAAATAWLLGLDAARCAHALAIALYQPTFTLWPGFMGPGSKVLTAAGPTWIGVQAAYLAAEGLTGARQIFEHRRKGFWRFFSFVPLAHMMTGLGQAWVTETLAFKRYPGCAYIDTTMDALFEVLGEYRSRAGAALTAGEIERIEVEASLLTIEMDNLSGEHLSAVGLSPVFVNFSIPASVAIGVLAGRLTSAELDHAFLERHGAEISALAGRVSLRHDWAATLVVSQAFDGCFGASSITAVLGLRDYLKVARGYARELGGARPHSLGVSRLLIEHWRALRATVLRTRGRARLARRARTVPDLGAVDFSAFRMAFPSRLTLTTGSGARYQARCEVPLGAPGDPGRSAAVREKVATEVGARRGGEAATRLIEVAARLEAHSLAELVAAWCASPT